MSDSTATLAAAPPASLNMLSLSLPIAMGYIPLGAVFGFLLIKAGAVWWLAPLASIFVFAGAAQYMAIPMVAAGLPYGAIALATLVVNLRHVFYGLSLLDRMPRHRLARGYLIWALTDENYSVLSALPRDTPEGKMVGIAMLNHGWWVLGSLLGAIIGAQVQLSLTGMDYSLAALFAVLAVEQWRSSRQLAPILIALFSYLLACWLMPAQALAVSIALCVLTGVFMSKFAMRRLSHD
jgi:4-azaleucine resistance transporter AzlC